MRLERGKDMLKPKAPIGTLHDAMVECTGYDFRLYLVSVEEITKFKRAAQEKNNGMVMCGMPAYIAFSEHEQALFFFPAADKRYKIGVYYQGQIQKQ